MSSDEDQVLGWEDYKERGNDAFKAGLFVRSIEEYTRAIEGNPTEPALYSNRAMAYLRVKKFKPAEDDARECIKLDYSYMKGFSRLCTALANQGRFSEAGKAIDEGLRGKTLDVNAAVVKELHDTQIKVRQAGTAIEKASDQLARSNLIGAMRTLGPVAGDFPDCFPVALLLAQARAPSDPDQALSALNGFADSQSENPEYLLARATATYYSSSPNALKNVTIMLREALELDPDHRPSMLLVKKCRAMEAAKTAGNEAFKQKKYSEAESEYTKAMNVDFSNKRFNAIVAANRAAARMELKNFQGALSDCNTAIDGKNDTPKVFARRARIYEQLDNFEDALRDMQQAAENDSSYAAELRPLKHRAKLAQRKDWYKVLGISKTASGAEVKKAYRQEALKWHPDKWANASEEEQSTAERRFKEAGEANAILSDAAKRRMYDSGQIDNETDHASGGASGGRGGMGGMPMGGMPMGGIDISELFNMMGGMGGGGTQGGMGGMPFPGMGGMPRGRGGRRPPPGFSFSFQ